jgi:hypothetical protein
MENKLIPIAIIAAIIIAFIGWTLPKGVSLGGYTAGDWEAADDLIAGDDATIGDDATVAGLATVGETLTVTGETNLDTLVQGGDVTTITTSSATVALTAAQFCDSSVISLDLSATNTTVTLPSTTTLAADCLPTAGDKKTVMFENAATSSLTATIAAGTGITLLEPSGGDVVIQQNEWATMECENVRSTEFPCTITSIQDAD